MPEEPGRLPILVSILGGGEKMEKKIFAFLMAMLILLMTNHIWAEEKREEKAVTLEEIVVTASRIEEPVKEVASSITVIIQKRR